MGQAIRTAGPGRLLGLMALVAVMAGMPAWAVRQGDKAPDFLLTSLEGDDISLSDLAGNVVVISFWASWGKQCDAELRQVEALLREFEGEPLVGIGVNERESAEQAAEFAARHEVKFPIVLDSGSLARAYGVNGVPDLFVVDRKGVVRARFIGYGPAVRQELREAVETALRGSSPAPSQPARTTEPSSLPPALRAYAHLQLGAAHINIGDAYVKAGYRDGGHFATALGEFRAGAALDPKNVELRVWLGLALERTGEREAAIKEYQAALGLDPANAYAQDALRRLGVPWRPETER